MSKNTKSATDLKPNMKPITKPQASKAERMAELLSSQQKTEPEANMLKVMETYRKSVDYYNSYGLKSADGSRNNKSGNSKQFSASTYQWGYN